MKDEYNGKIITEFAGLCAKSYSCKILNERSEKKKVKCITRSTLRSITFNYCKSGLFEYQHVTEYQNLIQSKKHEVHTIKQKKVSLS